MGIGKWEKQLKFWRSDKLWTLRKQQKKVAFFKYAYKKIRPKTGKKL